MFIIIFCSVDLQIALIEPKVKGIASFVRKSSVAPDSLHKLNKSNLIFGRHVFFMRNMYIRNMKLKSGKNQETFKEDKDAEVQILT